MKILIEILDRYTDSHLTKSSGFKPVTYIITINEQKITLTNKTDLRKVIEMHFKSYE